MTSLKESSAAFGQFLDNLKRRYNEPIERPKWAEAVNCAFNRLDKVLQADLSRNEDRRQLLDLVDTKSVLRFEQVFAPEEFTEHRFEYLESGAFGLAFVMKRGRRRQEFIIKSICCLPRKGGMSYLDVYNEINCMRILSKLMGSGIKIRADNQNFAGESEVHPQGRLRFKAECFPQLNKVFLCGNSQSMLTLDTLSPASLDCLLCNHYESAIILMEHCGRPLLKLLEEGNRQEAIVSIVKQVIIGLCIAESIFHFEHRDLHLSNVLAQETDKDRVRFIYKSKIFSVESFGYRAKIIDFTYSRITHKQKVSYKDLSFIQDVADEGNVYVKMASCVGNQWHQYSARSNLLWVTCLIAGLVESVEKRIEEKGLPDENQQLWAFTLEYLRSMHRVAETCDDMYALFNHLTTDSFNSFVQILQHRK